MRAIVFALIVAAQVQQFEVVSIKPGDPSDPASGTRSTPGGISLTNTTLGNLVTMAYDLNRYQLAGVPKWAESARFNVDAKMPGGANRGQIPRMLQALLAERFHLEFHREAKPIPQYALVVAKDGAKLQPASEDDQNQKVSAMGPRLINARGATMAGLAVMLNSVMDAPVIDRTSLTGMYTISLKFTPLMGPPEDTLPDIYGAVQQLGLKLEPIKADIEMFVIDNVSMPSAN